MTRGFADIGAAVIGTGFIGTVHVEALRRIGVQVRGVLGSTPERGAGPRHGARRRRARTRHSTSSSPIPAVEVVHVTSPNDLHVPQSLAVLAAGRHVVCEKPLAMTATESAGLVGGRRRDRPRERGQLQHPSLPAQPARARGGGGGRARRGPAGHRALFPGLAAPPHVTGTGAFEPDRGGALRAVGDIGSHWLDLMTFVTGQRIVAVMADLATFIPSREEPTGPVETFSTERSAETVDARRSRPRTPRRSCCASRTAPGVASASRQISPGRKNSLRSGRSTGRRAPLAWDSENPDQIWQGHRERPNEILIKNPALMGAGRPGGRGAPRRPRRRVRGHVRGPLPGRSTPTSRRDGRRRGPPTRPSPTATTRCSSTTRSPRARGPAAGWTSSAIAAADAAAIHAEARSR